MPAVLTPPAATMITRGDPGRDAARQEPTLASAWQAVAGSTISDKLLDWPPDLFTLTEVILQRSQAYRFALSPQAGATWPPARCPDWPDAVTDAARRWSAWAEDRNGSVPDLLAQEWAVLRARAGTPLSQLAQARDWRLCEALLTLHAIADEACAGLGVGLDAAGADGLAYRARGRSCWPGRAPWLAFRHSGVAESRADLSSVGRCATLGRQQVRDTWPPGLGGVWDRRQVY